MTVTRRVRLLLTVIAAVVAALPVHAVVVGAQPAARAGGSGAAVETIAATRAAGLQLFQMIGASWVGPDDVDAKARVRSAGTWGPWTVLHVDEALGPNGTEAAPRVVAEPTWVADADAYELQVPPGATEVRAHLIRASTSSAPASSDTLGAASTVPGAPPTFSRSDWGARPPIAQYFTTPRMAFVHHSAGTNDYAPGDVPAIIRGIQAYHMDVQGWDDIAYNWLVDRFGRIWEGRGGLDQTVRGGHTGGFNTDSVGVAALGDFTKVSPPSAVIGATADIIGWVLGRAGADPMGTATMTAGGHPNSRYAAGEVVSLPAVSGHLDVSYTSCPGALYDTLGAIRQRAAIRAAQANTPFGSVDSIRRAPGGLRVSGWVIDPNAESSSDVHIYVGSAGYPTTASISRPDVAATFGFGDLHGFSMIVPTGAGAITVCVYGINVGPGGNALIRCYSVTVSSDPLGSMDGVERAPGGMRIAGWALDPDIADSIQVRAYVGDLSVIARADGSRPDLQPWFPGYGVAHGFSTLVPAQAGRQRVCTYAINQGAGVDTALRCVDVTVEVSPHGSLDGVQRTGDGMRVSGWAIDPDVATPITVSVYSNGVFVGSMVASTARPDVGAAYPRYGAGHGFSGLVTAQPGRQTVCAYGINVASGGNALLGCTSVA